MTTRKQCQLKFAIKCIENNTRSFVVENRDFMYDDQHNMLNYNDKNFVIRHSAIPYFPSWLSGFIEAEGNFRLFCDKRRNMQVYSRFNVVLLPKAGSQKFLPTEGRQFYHKSCPLARGQGLFRRG